MRIVRRDGAALSTVESPIAEVCDHHGVRWARDARSHPAWCGKARFGEPGHQCYLCREPSLTAGATKLFARASEPDAHRSKSQAKP